MSKSVRKPFKSTRLSAASVYLLLLLVEKKRNIILVEKKIAIYASQRIMKSLCNEPASFGASCIMAYARSAYVGFCFCLFCKLSGLGKWESRQQKLWFSGSTPASVLRFF